MLLHQPGWKWRLFRSILCGMTFPAPISCPPMKLRMKCCKLHFRIVNIAMCSLSSWKDGEFLHRDLTPSILVPHRHTPYFLPPLLQIVRLYFPPQIGQVRISERQYCFTYFLPGCLPFISALRLASSRCTRSHVSLSMIAGWQSRRKYFRFFRC